MARTAAALFSSIAMEESTVTTNTASWLPQKIL
jgi:hypothetical protein